MELHYPYKCQYDSQAVVGICAYMQAMRILLSIYYNLAGDMTPRHLKKKKVTLMTQKLLCSIAQ